MKIKRLILFIPLFLLFTGQTFVQAETEEDSDLLVEEEIFEQISLDHIETYWKRLGNDYGGYLPEIKKTSLMEFVKENNTFSIKNSLLGALKYLLHEIILNGKLLGMIFLLTLFSVFLQTLHTSFDNGTVSKIAYFVVYIVLLFLALNSFYIVVSYAKDAIDGLSSFMIALIPLMLGLMASFGNVMAVSFFHPIIVFLVHVSGVLVAKIIFPLLLMSALLFIVSSLSDKYKVTYLANLFKNIALGLLGAFLTIFLGVMSVQGAASAVQDGIGMKAAKFVTANFIPVVGRAFTDATDTILSASLLLKNAVGIVGVVIILFITLFPALKIFAIALIYKIAAALLQPIGDGPVITSLQTISKYIMYILASLMVVSIMFFLGIVIIIAASNLTMLLR